MVNRERGQRNLSVLACTVSSVEGKNFWVLLAVKLGKTKTKQEKEDIFVETPLPTASLCHHSPILFFVSMSRHRGTPHQIPRRYLDGE